MAASSSRVSVAERASWMCTAGKPGFALEHLLAEKTSSVVGSFVHEALELLMLAIERDPVFRVVLGWIEGERSRRAASREVAEARELPHRFLVELGGLARLRSRQYRVERGLHPFRDAGFLVDQIRALLGVRFKVVELGPRCMDVLQLVGDEGKERVRAIVAVGGQALRVQLPAPEGATFATYDRREIQPVDLGKSRAGEGPRSSGRRPRGLTHSSTTAGSTPGALMMSGTRRAPS